MKHQFKKLDFAVGIAAAAGALAIAGAWTPGGGGEPPKAAAGGCCTQLTASQQKAAGDVWCSTQEHFVAKLAQIQGKEQGQGYGAVSLCPQDGPADDPIVRDLAIPNENTPIKTYRLIFHVFSNKNGSDPAASAADVADRVGWLNGHYAPWKIRFEYEISTHKDTTYRYLTASEEYGMKNKYASSPATQLNIYVVTTDGTSWGTFPWDPDSLGKQGGIVMNNALFHVGSPLPHILSHEVGHCIGLWHTFHGVEEVAQCGDCYEPAGRTPEVGDVTGDRCSDTQPTTYNTNNCTDPPGTDPCSGNPWSNAPYANFMGYSHPCAAMFTPQQAGRMHAWTEDALTGWLVLPGPPSVPGNPSAIKLSSGLAQISWGDNSGDEDGFEVQREKKSGRNWTGTTIVAVTGPDVTSVTDQAGSGTFHYRVRAFNGLGASAWTNWAQVKL